MEQANLKQGGFMKLLIATGLILMLTGCSHLILVKQCKQVEGEDKHMCRMIKPWE